MAEKKKVLLKIDNLKQYFPVKKHSVLQKEQLYVKANDGISLDIYEGETFGLVGESGCGKSTLGRVILQLYEQTSGRTMYYGRDIDELAPAYVRHTLTNLGADIKKQKALRIGADTVKAQYENMPDGDEKLLFIAKVREAEYTAQKSLIDIVQLIGGFYVSDDYEAVSRILIEEHDLTSEYFKVSNRLNELHITLDGTRSELNEKGVPENKINEAVKKQTIKLEELKAKLNELDTDIKSVRSRIYEMMEKLKSNPEFDKYEAYRDKGIDLTRLTENEMRYLRKDMQLIFQDPYSSLNPRMTVGQIIGEGLLAHRFFKGNNDNMQKYIIDIMDKCGLAPYFIHRYPHQFSGGQRQRIGIARSLALKPKFIVCDEAVSALDVSIQSQILNLLLDLKENGNLTYMFISHDLSVIKYISDRIGVMYLGNIIETAATDELFNNPTHPYTEALLSAIPTTEADNEKKISGRILLEGDIPSPIKPPDGCKFHTRCRYCTDICKKVEPLMEEVAPNHLVACHHKLGIYGKSEK